MKIKIINNKRYRFLSVLLAAVLLFEPLGVNAAAYGLSDGAGQENSLTPEDLTGTTDAEDEVFPTETLDNCSVKDLFPGLPEDYEFSDHQIMQKEILTDYAEDNISSGDGLSVFSAPHAEGEVVYLTDSEEDAQLVAQAFGGALESYAYDVAVITLPVTSAVLPALPRCCSRAMTAVSTCFPPFPPYGPIITRRSMRNTPTLLSARFLRTISGSTVQWGTSMRGTQVIWGKM